MSKHQRCNYVAEPVRLTQYEKSSGQAQRVYSVRGKSVALNANGGGQGGKTGLYKIDLPDGDYIIRKLSPIECERLQTMPDNFTQYGKNEKGELIEISNSQRYKCIGNSWTADVIAYIFSFLKEELNGKGQA
jgi:DNA (cytosine-5)-methyltransferase 3A